MTWLPLHGSAAEWTQATIATVGCVVSALAIARAARTALDARFYGLNGRTAFWGAARVRQESVLFMLHLVAFWVPGVLSLFMEPGGQEMLSKQSLMRVGAQMSGTIILTVFSLLRQWDLDQLLEYEEPKSDDAAPRI